MTTNIRLVDVFHDSNASVLVRSTLENKLAEMVLEKLTDNTALCVEGIFSMRQHVKPHTVEHENLSEKLWPGYKHLTTKHVFFGADCRSRIDYGLHMKVGEETDILLNFLDENLILTEHPPSVQEAVDWVRGGRRSFSFVKQPTVRIKECADRVFRREKLWIKDYAQLASGLARTHEQVYIIAGLSHAISLHIKYGWPIMWLTSGSPEFTSDFVYRAAMNLSHFADAVRRA